MKGAEAAEAFKESLEESKQKAHACEGPAGTLVLDERYVGQVLTDTLAAGAREGWRARGGVQGVPRRVQAEGLLTRLLPRPTRLRDLPAPFCLQPTRKLWRLSAERHARCRCT